MSPNINAQVGQQLKKRRKSLKLSQTQLGEILGITYQQIQKYESGVNKVSPDRLVDLSKALDAPLGYFFEGVESVSGYVEAKPHDTTSQILVSEEKRDMLNAYDKLPTHVKRQVREFINLVAITEK